MATHNYNSVGIGHVGSYQVSGHPWISGSANLARGGEVKFEFPYVTKRILVIHNGNGAGAGIPRCRIHWAPQAQFEEQPNTLTGWEANLNRNFIELNANKNSIELGVKCADLYISNHGTVDVSFTVYAELTHIERRHMYALDGKGIKS